MAPLRLRRGQGAMQRNPCYARLFANLAHTPQGAFSCPFGTIHLVSPNPIQISGGRVEHCQWQMKRGGGPVSKGAPGRPHGPTQRGLCELHCGPRTPGGFSTGWGSPFSGDPIIFPRSCPSSLRPRVQYDLPGGIAPKIPQHHIPFCRAGIHDLARAHIYAHMVYFV